MAFVVIHATAGSGTGGGENVGETVVIVVDEGDAAARRLDDELLRERAAVGDSRGQSGFAGDISKIRMKFRTLGSGDAQRKERE